MLIDEGSAEAALADLEGALAERPDPDTAALRAYCLFRLGRWRKALEISEADLCRYGGEPAILWALAPLRWREGRIDDAARAAWAYLVTGGFSSDVLWLLALHSCMGGDVAGGTAARMWVVPRGGPYVQLTDSRGAPLGFALFDTGQGGVILAPSVLGRLARTPLELLENHEMRAMGDEGTIRGRFWSASNVVFGFAGARGITPEAVAGEFVPMSRFTELGFDVAGIIGYSVFRDLFCRVRIDLPARTMVWWRREEPPRAAKEKSG
ncbi:MAG: tetratricopeptide repeat protein [Planctomycetota bacterium]